MKLSDFRNEPFTDFSQPENQQAFEAARKKVEQDYLGRTWPCWIGGEQVTGEKTFDGQDPSELSRHIGTYQELGKAEADAAVDAAYAAFPEWSRTDAQYRIDLLLKAVHALRERKHEFSAMLCYEVGKSWAEADGETAEAIDFLEYYAYLMKETAGPHPLTPVEGEQNHLQYIPIGVGAVIPPWNFPLAIMAGMTSAALITGNTVVLKPAEQSPAVAGMWLELMHEVGLPKHVLNFVTGPGEVVGAAMVQHPRTRFISFTGSRQVGLWIHEQSAKVQDGQQWMKRLVAEMGGKDSMLIDAECDLDAAVDAVVAAAYGFQGQKCSACSRAIVHQDVYDEFRDKLVPKVAAIQAGHPATYGCNFGAVIDPDALKKSLDYIAIGKQEGTMLVGSDDAPAGGHYVMPHVFDDIAPDARLAQDEVFGPVLALIKVEDFEQGLEVANNTDYGLTGSVFTDNEQHKREAIDRFHVGNFYINRKCTGALVGAHPFGGFNMSGTDSKAGGPDYLMQFLQAKSICEKIG